MPYENEIWGRLPGPQFSGDPGTLELLHRGNINEGEDSPLHLVINLRIIVNKCPEVKQKLVRDIKSPQNSVELCRQEHCTNQWNNLYVTNMYTIQSTSFTRNS